MARGTDELMRKKEQNAAAVRAPISKPCTYLKRPMETIIHSDRLSDCQQKDRLEHMVQGKHQISNNIQIPISNDPKPLMVDFGHSVLENYLKFGVWILEMCEWSDHERVL